MSGDDVVMTPSPETSGDVKSRKGRRILGLVLAILVLLLLVISFFIFRLLQPAGKIASPAETRGVEWVRSIYGWGTGPGQQLTGPAVTSIGPDGTIWVAEPTTKQIVGFNPDGTYHSSMTAGGKLAMPSAVEVGPDGTFYVVESVRDTVHVLSRDDKELMPPLRIQDPNTVAANGDVFVVGAKAGFAIFKKDGTLVKQVGSAGKEIAQFDMVNGIAFGPDGTFYVVDQFNNRISAWDVKGNQKWILVTGTPGNQQGVKGKVPLKDEIQLQLPVKITVDSKGRLVVVDPFDFSLTAIDPASGKFLAKYGEFGQQDGKFSYPSGVDYDPARDWFAVADTQNNRVQIIRIPGSGATQFSALARSLSGPLRACFFPLLLLLLAILIALAGRWRRKRADAEAAARLADEDVANATHAETTGDHASE